MYTKKMPLLTLTITFLMLFAGPISCRAFEKLKIEYTITEACRLCDMCGGRGIVPKKGLEIVEFGDENSSSYEVCPKCNGNKFIKSEGEGWVNYYTKNVGVISFSPEAKRQKLFNSKRYRREFLNKYFFVDYVLVVTKTSKAADIAKLPKALQIIHYLKLEMNSLKKAVVDRETGKTTFEFIYSPTVKEAAKKASETQNINKTDTDEFDTLAEDKAKPKKEDLLVEDDAYDEPVPLYLSFGSQVIKDKTEQALKDKIIAIKKKYHILYD